MSTDFAQTELQIIARALRLCGQLKAGEGEVPSAGQMLEAREALNALVKHLQSDGIRLWTVERRELPLVADQQEYALPDDVLSIHNLFVRDDQDSDHWVELIDKIRYDGITDKLDTGRPTQATLEWATSGVTLPVVSFSVTGTTVFGDTLTFTNVSTETKDVSHWRWMVNGTEVSTNKDQYSAIMTAGTKIVELRAYGPWPGYAVYSRTLVVVNPNSCGGTWSAFGNIGTGTTTVNYIYQTTTGRLLIGTDAGLYKSDSPYTTFTHVTKPAGWTGLDRVDHIIQETSGRIWFLYEGLGVAWSDNDGDTLSYITSDRWIGSASTIIPSGDGTTYTAPWGHGSGSIGNGKGSSLVADATWGAYDSTSLDATPIGVLGTLMVAARGRGYAYDATCPYANSATSDTLRASWQVAGCSMLGSRPIQITSGIRCAFELASATESIITDGSGSTINAAVPGTVRAMCTLANDSMLIGANGKIYCSEDGGVSIAEEGDTGGSGVKCFFKLADGRVICGCLSATNNLWMRVAP